MEKVSLVLSGGGSRGSYEIGVWQALNELGIPIDIVTGTSVGALNAAFVAMGDFDAAMKLWKEIETSMVFSVDVDETLPLKQRVAATVKCFVTDYAKQGGTDANPLKLLLDKYIDEEKLRSSGVDFGLVTFNKKNFTPLEIFVEEIAQGELNDYLIASASLFPAIKSCEINDGEYIDGGYCDNLPVSLALQKDADYVIAVDLNAVGVVRHDVLKLAKNLKIIKSHWDLGPLLVFDNAIITRNIRLGYLDAMKSFNVFEGHAYTFVKNEISKIIKENKTQIAEQNNILSLNFKADIFSPLSDLLAIKILGFIKKEFPDDKKLQFSHFLLCCMECAAKMFNMPPETLYRADVFNYNLLQKVSAVSAQSESPIDLQGLKKSLALLEPQNRAIYLGALIKKAVMENKPLDLFKLSFLMPEDILSAYYLALIS